MTYDERQPSVTTSLKSAFIAISSARWLSMRSVSPLVSWMTYRCQACSAIYMFTIIQITASLIKLRLRLWHLSCQTDKLYFYWPIILSKRCCILICVICRVQVLRLQRGLSSVSVSAILEVWAIVFFRIIALLT